MIDPKTNKVERGLRIARPWTTWLFDVDNQIDVYQDGVPVTEGHLLFVPKMKEHSVDMYKHAWERIPDCLKAAHEHGLKLVENGKCDGYNVGINVGTAAGQTVSFPHVHLIPRRHGDMEDPRGGVRHVIPDRGNYKTSEHYKDVKLD